MAPYPSAAEIRRFASSLATSDPSPFFDKVASDVDWEVMGTHPAAGRFKSLDAWKKGALEVINVVLREPLKLEVVNVFGGGDSEWATIELKADSVCKNGMPYPQRYAWLIRFDKSGTIVQAKAYLDSALVQKAIDTNSGQGSSGLPKWP
ncbi:putative NTF2-like domain superfamily protein [Septoria linicola]|nr:putative NTF2-like domain superfamily protein [Septoria linicola]